MSETVQRDHFFFHGFGQIIVKSENMFTVRPGISAPLPPGLFSFRFFRPILDAPDPVGAVCNRTGLEKEYSKIATIREFV